MSDFVELTPGLAGFFGLSVDHGVYAVGVEPDGPAAQAGIQEGDIIVAIDGTEIDEATSLTDVLFQHRAGDTVQVTVARDGSEQTLAVTLGTRPAS